MKKRTWPVVVATALLTALFCFGVSGTLFHATNASHFGELERVGRLLEARYNGEEAFDWDVAQQAAISAVIESLADPHADYYNAEDSELLKEQVDGGYVGIGTVISVDPTDNCLTVVGIYPGSPAEKAGIEVWDKLLSIDGTDYDGDSLEEATDYMRGVGVEEPVGQELELRILRGAASDYRDDVAADASGEELTITLTRELVEFYPVTCETYEDGFVYLRYTSVDQQATEQLQAFLESECQDAAGIVLDLRGNPGGDVELAAKVCSFFMSDQLVTYTLDKNQNRTNYRTEKGEVLTCPVAVLVDENSASAAEIIAGALQDHARATLFGTKTYGKGTAQSVLPTNLSDFPDLSYLKFTEFKTFTPNGASINDAITPDVIVEESEGDSDAPLDAALAFLRQTINEQ